jgi:hypothetical protein
MLEDVPRELRQAWANAWVATLSRVREAMDAGDEERAGLALRWVLILPQLLLRTRPRTAPSVPNYLNRRFRLFETGRYGSLLREWAADAVLTAAEAPQEGAQSKVSHAMRLLSKGLMSRAAQHLSSVGSADPADPAVRAQMCRKCPKRVVNVPPQFIGVAHGGLELDLKEAMRLLRPMSGVGCSGLRNEYLRALVLVDNITETVKLTEWFGKCWVNGLLPPWFVATYMGARIAPLVKGDLPARGTPDCRPVAVGETFRRLVTSKVMRDHKELFKDALWPQQAAVGVESGQQLVTTGVSVALQQRPDFVAVKVDLANAFNECTRAAMLSAVARVPALAGLLPMYAATLSVASPLYMTGANGQLEKIGTDCQEGGHQGCASTGAAFCLAIHPSVVAADAALEAVGGCARFFADDGYLIGPADAVLAALDVFGAQVRAECGLRLNVSKTEFYAASGGTAALARPLLEGRGLKEGMDADGRRGIVVVGIPVGEEEYVIHYVRRRIEGASSKSTSIIMKLVPFELQAAQVLTYYCLAPLVDYLASSIPPDAIRAELRRWDAHMVDSIVPSFLPPAVATDPLLTRRLRMPARHDGGALRARGEWLAATAYAATMIRILPAMTDSVVDGVEKQGYLHNIMVPILGTVEDAGGRYSTLDASNSDLAHGFRSAYGEMQAAAAYPTTGPLADPFVCAGLNLKSKEAMARHPDDDNQKLFEQKQYTELIEDHLNTGLRADFAQLHHTDMRKAAYFSVNASSRHFLYTPPFPGCELDTDEFGVVAARYYGARCPACAPLVGKIIRSKGSNADGKELDAYGKTLVNANVGQGLWTKRHDAMLRAISAELYFINNVHKTDAYGVFEGKFGDGSEEASRLAEAFFAGDERRKQGCVPDIDLEVHEVEGIRIVEKPTLYELKQINLRAEYFQVNAWKTRSHAVHRRADTVHTEYLRKLHDVDRAAGTPCPHTLTQNGSCARSDNNLAHGVGGGERHLLNKYGHVRALVFGHFGEFNDGLLKLADDISKSVAKQHHRMLGFKSEAAGRSRAKAGVMRRLSMVALRSTARHVLRGLAIVGPPCIHQHNAREAARRAHHDAFGADRGAPWRNPTDGGG